MSYRVYVSGVLIECWTRKIMDQE